MEGRFRDLNEGRMFERLYNCNSFNRIAYTLAEVLITIAVIGVVASMTIVPFIHKYKIKQYETAFKRTNLTLSNAVMKTCFEFDLKSLGDLGSYASKNASELQELRNGYFKEINDYFVSQLKYVKKYVKANKEVKNRKIYHFLSNAADNTYFYPDLYGLNPYNHSSLAAIYILPDGSAITAMSFFYHSTSDGCPVRITFDTNGPARGPNRVGYDIFPICYGKNGKIGGCSTYNDKNVIIHKHMLYPCAVLNQYPEDKTKKYWDNLK